MADDRNRREDVDDSTGADPARPGDMADEAGRGSDDVRGIAADDDDEFEDSEDIGDEDESDGSL
jgi:hypothetical protein